MRKVEFERKFPQSYLDEIIEAAFQAIRKNKKLPLEFSHSSVKENYTGVDDTTEITVDIYYNNGSENHVFEVIERVFDKDDIWTDRRNGANKITDYKTKLILRIAWRIWRHETGANYK